MRIKCCLNLLYLYIYINNSKLPILDVYHDCLFFVFVFIATIINVIMILEKQSLATLTVTSLQYEIWLSSRLQNEQ